VGGQASPFGAMHLLTIALVAGASLRRYGRGYQSHGRRSFPELQHQDTYEDDFAHDDTEHPQYAVKVNIKESDQAVQDTMAKMDALEGKIATAKKAADAADKAYQSQVDETTHAEEMVAKYNASLHGLQSGDIQAGIDTAQADLDTALAAMNKTDQDSAAAAEGIKAADDAFHAANVEVAEAKENVTLAEDVVTSFEAKVAEGKKANVSFAEWQQKLNTSQEGADAVVAQMKTAQAAYDKVHGHSEAAEARLSEAQKLFDVDKDSYEELVGPYTPSGQEKEEDDEWRWWDIFSR